MDKAVALVPPSGLSILLARRAAASESEDGEDTPTGPRSYSPAPAPTTEPSNSSSPFLSPETDLDVHPHQNNSAHAPIHESRNATESTPLLARSYPPNRRPAYFNAHGIPLSKSINRIVSFFSRPLSIAHPNNIDPRSLGKTALKSLPAVILGTLLNILDGVSYGMIIFPAFGVFADLAGMGVSMFFASTVISQLVYTLGGSSFAGANGSMMIEVVPFFHILATTIAHDIGEENAREVIATTLVAYAFSSILTGLTFFLLGYLRLGVLIGFFPRHILILHRCIGGVGVFLILTGLTVSTGLPSDSLGLSIDILRFFFLDIHTLTLWLVPAVLAITLRIITARWKHQLIFPVFFLIIPIVFYIVVAAARLDLATLRKEGWLFDSAQGAGGSQDKWYSFYSYYDLNAIRFWPLWATLPTQFALLFFNILHPPLNVPALSISLNQDIDTNKELVGHGASNFLAGLLGTVPNYLVYVNTLLFYRVGGDHRVAGFLLAVATFVLLTIGTAPIAYIPVMVVGSLIFVLGIDLVKEALWDTRHRVSRMEYVTIISIMVCMTVWDFVIGVLFGIVVSCFFFVVQNSQRRSIRACYTGDAAMSTVRRPAAHRAYIREVSKQTMILRLQGFLFFGTIAHVEDTLRNIVSDPASWQRNPVRFVVVDLSLVAGVDMSSAEAFVRVQRLLAAKGVILIFCGVSHESAVGQALGSVGVLEEAYVEVFETFSDAIEWTENAYLRAWFRVQKNETSPIVLSGRNNVDLRFDQSLAGSPRRSQLRDIGGRTIAQAELSDAELSFEPNKTLLKVFSSYDEVDNQSLVTLARYFERISVPSGLVLWEKDDSADGLYVIESGSLRASYKFSEHSTIFEESMLSGALAGEMSALSGLPRNATVVVEQPAVLWKLSMMNMSRLEIEQPALAHTFVQLVLKAAKVDNDILLAALATR
ncbi:sulfate transporter family-domain-containing protein [Hygrophoropsis aurantiaca]|uniref:Sulfate transporter family-domain-containing protein n=1 Tax=Hygrophoropsis aurantiaca TaxID=72124 RepID=A0ACB8ANI9_9AGAM|nr:sulfate transporter family-domain-containing protein [Hygrophoropsis aurantiaca]